MNYSKYDVYCFKDKTGTYSPIKEKMLLSILKENTRVLLLDNTCSQYNTIQRRDLRFGLS